MNSITNRNIPLGIKREIRQRCGFGCVICGLPLYEYEHMKEWAKVKRHNADEITLLCNQHHSEKTKGLLPLQDVINANSNPYNLRKGVSKPYNLHFNGQTVKAKIGSNLFVYNHAGEGLTHAIPISIDQFPIFSVVLQDKHILINIILFDKFNKPILEIINNQLVYVTNSWDIQFVGTTLTIREAKRNILIEIKFIPPDSIEIIRGRILLNGIMVEINSKQILINEQVLMANNLVHNCPRFLALGIHTDKIPSAYNFELIDRY